MGKWFPRFYDILMEPLERRRFREIRNNLLQDIQGRVLEIGSGTGFNFSFYKQAQKVIAIEPEPLMRDKSLPRAKRANVPLEVVLASAEELPFPDDSFDAVVGTLVLCTIPNPTKALQEISRVCKPDGSVLFFEHVRLNHPVLGRLQDLLTPVWKHLCDGCHLNRNTLELVKQAGFQVINVERYYKKLFLVIKTLNKK